MSDYEMKVRKTAMGLVVHRQIGDVETLHVFFLLIWARVGKHSRWWWELPNE